MMMWKQLNIMQQSSCCRVQNIHLRGALGTDRNHVVHVYKLILKGINLTLIWYQHLFDKASYMGQQFYILHLEILFLHMVKTVMRISIINTLCLKFCESCRRITKLEEQGSYKLFL